MSIKVRTVRHSGSREVVEIGRGQKEGVLGLMKKYNFLARQGYWSGLPFPSPGDLPN